MAFGVYAVHVSGGYGRVYRAHFRRDWPTGQAFPCLWPHRIALGAWDIFGWPGFGWDFMNESLSSVGVVSDDGQEMSYAWVQSFFLDECHVDATFGHGFNDREMTSVFLFTDPGRAGFLRITCNAYIIDDETGSWQITRDMPEHSFTFDAVGEFSGCDYLGSSPLVEMFSAVWSQLPEEERFP